IRECIDETVPLGTLRAEFVGQTPWSARVPLDPLACRRIKPFDHCERPTRRRPQSRGTTPDGPPWSARDALVPLSPPKNKRLPPPTNRPRGPHPPGGGLPL